MVQLGLVKTVRLQALLFCDKEGCVLSFLDGFGYLKHPNMENPKYSRFDPEHSLHVLTFCASPA